MQLFANLNRTNRITRMAFPVLKHGGLRANRTHWTRTPNRTSREKHIQLIHVFEANQKYFQTNSIIISGSTAIQAVQGLLNNNCSKCNNNLFDDKIHQNLRKRTLWELFSQEFYLDGGNSALVIGF